LPTKASIASSRPGQSAAQSNAEDMMSDQHRTDFRSGRRRDARYDLLMALDHLLEGAQLYSKAVQEATRSGDEAIAEYFRHLERTSRVEAERARELLDGLSVHAPALVDDVLPRLVVHGQS
jgi:hypothetical protein